ncbi:response regulator transcription factor [Sulfurovum sp. bin170]|uniref:response regulator transcription factor n=1 Tax=Sulfurovum sp. bin170 TaxID=2695268 RepID=UPI0013E039B4|nr:response regulator transcription factor [Sulfurovum sp. bin170]NEW60140.1 response regulator transcription factor [Sulfurovum sp. bin170]
MKTQLLEIVIIEDEEDILELIEYHLQKAGYETMGFLSTESVEQFLEEETPALMIVDRNLPGVEGAEFVKHLRSYGYDIPVIFLTAKDSDSELEEGFLSGGDDYMTKPFRVKELILRVEAILKRSGALGGERIKHRDLTLDISRRELYIDKRYIELTNLEFNLIQTFIRNSNMVLERNFLREEVWGEDSTSFDENRTIKVAINRLKKKIDPNGAKNYFVSVRGVGYKMV